ncbi:ABC transporter ATP-binding protein/permease [Mycolicibacterium brumae]|uniref:Mycobactin import ATP-binding/permease protein IrtA n=1 Tax=Mycolicibacterium brumae TaxID=85968 RepID=A0A2G5PG73_9MYCO|nr:ABC transporter ATP-binding protein/permease [Mycolicibacterium brumae]MCV7194377.1 ATP-binding cassette domain-containing protein [Mycolicibacterium brumae]PIB77308.1 iron ABC transporter permease [Mycolicibacterium brumae]UWW10585.1 ATP-binding cassette domain-containing protein [Mycolicibacterium brumae]
MARGLQGALLRGFGARDHIATVTGTELLTPNFLRIRLTSPTVFNDLDAQPTAWLRFWFPDPDGSDTEFQRAYTLSEADPESGDFAIDVVLHDPAGPASLWARSAGPGDQIAVMAMGSVGFHVTEEPPAGYLLVGDAASTPAINGIIGAVPSDIPIECYLETHHDDDLLIPIAEHPRLRVHRVPRADTTSLATAVESRDWSNWYAWVGCETGSLKHLRNRLRGEFGFPKSEMHAQAYWIFGCGMGSWRVPESTDEPEQTPEVVAAPQAQGSWRAQGAGQLLAPLRTPLIVSGVLQALVTLAQLAPYVLLVELARLLLAGAEPDRLKSLGLAAIVLLGVGTTLGAALTLWLHVIDARFARDLRGRLLDKMSRLPLGWFIARGSGSVKQHVADDPLALHYLVTHAVPDAVNAVVAPVAVLVYLFVVDWRLALALLIPVIGYILLMLSMAASSGPKVLASQRWAERMSGEAAGYLDGQPVVRIFGGAAASGFRRRLDEYLEFLVDWQQPFVAKKTLMDLVTRPSTFLWLITALGTWLIVSGRMDPVDLLPFLFLGATFGARLLGIGYGISGISGGVQAARRIQNTLDETDLATRESSGADAAGGRDVVFDNVTFGYRPGVPVIRDVNLTLAPGTVTALVGPSGSGKSTLAALLARFYDVQSGAIRIGGVDIAELDADELYRRVGFVLQDPQLVRGTVAENIALADPQAGTERIMQAARDAQIHDRITALPEGYGTVLGPDAALSGGEKQRLTIARAILADTDVLILDEATAFADPESEYQVQQALNRLTADRTVLVIAHRLHTITGADNIVVLDDGAIAESGTHSELLERGGRYRALWDTGGFAHAGAASSQGETR